MNILNLVRGIITSDTQLNQIIGSRVYYYKVTENADVSKPFVVLTPILDEPSDFASDKYLSEEYLIQVDVESTNHQKTIDITKRIRLLLFINNMMQASSQLDEYFKETKRYVMSRRYRGIPKNQYYKGERIE
ncbi:hypothetical protein ACJVVW_09595 [Staphylococcus coagulans]|uniref:hypothetical protein n=1 Tax=Staphylococcus coagulans TaxID=74706 RepID=UPI003980D039